MKNNPYNKVLLIIPPSYEVEFPPLGTPALIAFLKSKGIKARQLDLNIKFREYLKRENKEYILSPAYNADKIRKRVYYYRELKYENKSGPLRPYAQFIPASFDFTEKILSSKNLFKFINDRKENIFFEFFQSEVVPLLKKEKYGLVGFSIVAPSQVIASFTFGAIIKKQISGLKIVMGGPWVSLFREKLLKRRDFFRFFDFLVYFEGETPLVSLVESLANKKPLRDVPNLIYKEKGRLVVSKKISEESMDALPCPDFTGLPLYTYTNPKEDKSISLTFETARGCYWGKCIFCNDLFSLSPRYREKSVERLIEDVKSLKKRFKAGKLLISNTVFSPWQMREFCQALIENNIKIRWTAMTRLEKEFDEELLALIKGSGCVMLDFGLESVRQRVLDLANKGTKTEVINRIIRDGKKIGLATYYQIMVGIPGETSKEAWETLRFSLKNPKQFALNCYYQMPKMRIYDNSSNFGITTEYNAKLPFRFYYPFRNRLKDMDENKVERIEKFYLILLHLAELKGKGNKMNQAGSFKNFNLYLQAAKYEKSGQLTKAIKFYDKLIKRLPDSPDLNLSLAKIYYRLRNYSLAVNPARRAVGLGCEEGHFIAGISLMKGRRYKEAIKELKKAKDFSPQNTDIGFMLSRCYKELGQRKNSVYELQKLYSIYKRPSRNF